MCLAGTLIVSEIILTGQYYIRHFWVLHVCDIFWLKRKEKEKRELNEGGREKLKSAAFVIHLHISFLKSYCTHLCLVEMCGFCNKLKRKFLR